MSKRDLLLKLRTAYFKGWTRLADIEDDTPEEKCGAALRTEAHEAMGIFLVLRSLPFEGTIFPYAVEPIGRYAEEIADAVVAQEGLTGTALLSVYDAVKCGLVRYEQEVADIRAAELHVTPSGRGGKQTTEYVEVVVDALHRVVVTPSEADKK